MNKNYTKFKKHKLRKSKKKVRKSKKRFRGGFINPFYEVGTIVGSLGHVLQNTISSFTIPPTPTSVATNPNPHPSNQYVNSPVDKTIQDIYTKL